MEYNSLKLSRCVYKSAPPLSPPAPLWGPGFSIRGSKIDIHEAPSSSFLKRLSLYFHREVSGQKIWPSPAKVTLHKAQLIVFTATCPAGSTRFHYPRLRSRTQLPREQSVLLVSGITTHPVTSQGLTPPSPNTYINPQTIMSTRKPSRLDTTSLTPQTPQAMRSSASPGHPQTQPTLSTGHHGARSPSC